MLKEGEQMCFLKTICDAICPLFKGKTVIAKDYTDKSTNIQGNNNVINNGQNISVNEKNETLVVQDFNNN